MPDEQKSCFACCPPIRAAGYEHLPHKNILRRFFRENSDRFEGKERKIHPVTGYSCWALGYLDPAYRLIGCLLHPERNNGIDLRYRIDYEDKCRRETCPEAKTFSLLATSERLFWLHLAEGLDSFSYSSRRTNPLFSLLGWGAPLLSMIATEEAGETFTRESFLDRYVFFMVSLAPKGSAYILRKMLTPDRLHLLRDRKFKQGFENLVTEISDAFAGDSDVPPQAGPSHMLGLEQDFQDFLRLQLRITRTHLDKALQIKKEVDRRIDGFGAQYDGN